MPFEFRKISDVGTSHPVVARLAAQTGEVLKWMNIDKGTHDAIMKLYVDALTQRLLRCHNIRDDLANKLNEGLSKYTAQPDGRSREVPHVIGLQEAAEEFLYQAKNFLRDLLGLYQIVYGCTLKDASDLTNMKGNGDSTLVEWATENFGPDHHLTQLLKTEQEWVADVIRMRNAVEHPGGYSGTLKITNVRVFTEGFVPPTWERTGGRGESSIVHDMDIILNNLLTFAEELLVHTAMDKAHTEHIRFYEIPVEKRRPEMPIRFQAGPSPELAAKLGKAEKGDTA
jgi:hypothetical protein